MPDRAFEVVESNWSGVVGDLRISNFKILPQTSTDLANITMSRGYCSFFSCQFPSPDAPRVLIQFDVETVSPLQLLGSRPYGATLLVVLGVSASYAPNDFGFYLSDDEPRLFRDHS